MVRPESKTHEAGELTMSLDTRGSSEYSSKSRQSPHAGGAAIRVIYLVGRLGRRTQRRDQVGDRHVGDRNAQARPSRCPATLGITSPVARAAPVVVGTMLMAAPEPGEGLCGGASTRFWSSV